MRRRDRLLAAGAVLAALALAKIGQEVYRWRAYAPERAEIGRLEVELEEAALGLVRTQIGADLRRDSLEALDRELRDARGDLDLLERGALDVRGRGKLSGYHQSLEGYNRRVRARNELFARWRRTLEENRQFVDRYNLAVDSIRTLAEGMGEPYYPIRTPAEIAVRHGIGEPAS